MNSSMSRWTDEHLMAWADGALPEGEVAALEAAIEADAALASRAAAMHQTRALVQEAYAARDAADPVPAALRAAVEEMVARDRVRRSRAHPAGVVASGRSGRGGALKRWLSGFGMPAAVAASLACGVVGFLIGQAGIGQPPSSNPSVQTPPPMASRDAAPSAAPFAVVGERVNPELARLLDELPSGGEARLGRASLAMVATYRDARDRLCRDFSVAQGGAQGDASRVESVACRGADDAWQVTYAAVERDGGSGFSPASSNSALEAYLGSIGADEPLDAEAERTALARSPR